MCIRDRWYVFGELNITEKQEVYNINLENNQYFVNNNNNYMVDVKIDNINKNSTYTIETYTNNTLIENINITNIENTYSNLFTFNLPEGDNTIKVIIKRNGEEVSKLEKSIYVYSAQENLTDISNTSLEKYSEFEEKFSQEIASIDGMQEQLDKLKNYMSSISGNTTETQENAIEMMSEHFALGTTILNAFNNEKLNVEYVRCV